MDMLFKDQIIKKKMKSCRRAWIVKQTLWPTASAPWRKSCLHFYSSCDGCAYLYNMLILLFIDTAILDTDY